MLEEGLNWFLAVPRFLVCLLDGCFWVFRGSLIRFVHSRHASLSPNYCVYCSIIGSIYVQERDPCGGVDRVVWGLLAIVVRSARIQVAYRCDSITLNLPSPLTLASPSRPWLLLANSDIFMLTFENLIGLMGHVILEAWKLGKQNDGVRTSPAPLAARYVHAAWTWGAGLGYMSFWSSTADQTPKTMAAELPPGCKGEP